MASGLVPKKKRIFIMNKREEILSAKVAIIVTL